MNFKTFLILIMVSLPFSAFSQCRYEAEKDATIYSPVPVDSVVIYDVHQVPKKAEEIGIIRCSSDQETVIIPKIKELVAAHGGSGAYYFIEKKDKHKGLYKFNNLGLLGTGRASLKVIKEK